MIGGLVGQAGLLISCGAAPPQVESAIAGRVSRDAALALVRDLVELGPRMGGTASGDRAAVLVADRLRALGLRVETVEDPPIRTHVEEGWGVSLGERRLASAWPYGFSQPAPRTSVPLSLDTPSPEGSDLARRAVLTGSLPRTVIDRLAGAGAAVLLTDHPGEPGRFIDWTPIRERRDSARLPVFGLSYRDGRLLREALERPDPAPITFWLESTISEGRPRTVVAALPGRGDRADRIVILCAHGDSDSGGPGADDNASGVAALVEVARALAWADAHGHLPGDRPEVRFIVWGSEYHSSESYARAHQEEMGRVVAVLNYDQVGSGAERDAIYIEGNDVPWNEGLLHLLESVARGHAGREGFWTSWTTTPSLGDTDAYSFLPREHMGSGIVREHIPVTTIFTSAWDEPTIVAQTPGWESDGWPETGDLFIDYSRYYHSSGDLPEHTTEAEPFNIERSARLAALGIYRLMSEATVKARRP